MKRTLPVITAAVLLLAHAAAAEETKPASRTIDLPREWTNLLTDAKDDVTRVAAAAPMQALTVAAAPIPAAQTLPTEWRVLLADSRS